MVLKKDLAEESLVIKGLFLVFDFSVKCNRIVANHSPSESCGSNVNSPSKSITYKAQYPPHAALGCLIIIIRKDVSCRVTN